MITEKPRLIEPRHIVGGTEISILFQVGRSTVAQWHSRADRNGFPTPIVELASGAIFDVNEVYSWYAQYRPLKGGRPGTLPLKSGGRYLPNVSA
jgi:hypothetical protein